MKEIKKTFKTAFFLASKSILRSDKWSLILVLAVLSIVFLNTLFTDAIFTGITKAMNDIKVKYQYGDITIEPAKGERFIKNFNDIKSYLAPYSDDIATITKIICVGASLELDENEDGRKTQNLVAEICGYSPLEHKLFDMEKEIVEGKNLSVADTRQILLGANLTNKFGANVFPDDLGAPKVGQKIKMYLGDQVFEYKIKGFFKTKNFQVDRRAYIPEKELRRMLDVPYNYASFVFITLKDKNKAKQISDFLRDKIKDDVSWWQEKLAFGAGISKSFEVIGAILRAMGAILAGLVVFIVIFVDILNKKRQIGIIKAIGVKNRVIILDYLLRGIFFSFWGVVFGYLLMRFVIRVFESNPIRMPMADVVPFLKNDILLQAAIFFMIASFIGAIVPAYKEARNKILILLYK